MRHIGHSRCSNSAVTFQHNYWMFWESAETMVIQQESLLGRYSRILFEFICVSEESGADTWKHSLRHKLKDIMLPCSVDLWQEKHMCRNADTHKKNPTLLRVRGDIQSSVLIRDEQCVLLVLWALARIINLVSHMCVATYMGLMQLRVDKYWNYCIQTPAFPGSPHGINMCG